MIVTESSEAANLMLTITQARPGRNRRDSAAREPPLTEDVTRGDEGF